MRSVSALWTLPIWSFQRVRRTVPVSSPTVASTSFLASPNFDVISLFTQTDHLDQDIHLLGGGGQVFDFRHCLVFHVLTSADTRRQSRKGRKNRVQSNSDVVG